MKETTPIGTGDESKETKIIGAVDQSAATEVIPANITAELDMPSNTQVAPVNEVLEERFLLERELGQGGIGKVYLARDLKVMNRQVVVKVMLENWAKDEDLRLKFEQEKEALARLNHPSIIEIFDAGLLPDGKPYFVMPYLQGRSLRDALESNEPLKFDFVAHVIQHLTDALAAAHAANILHRDVKPENVMLTPQPDDEERVWLLDFGIARIFDSQVAPVTQIERGVGTILYVAPEQLRGSLNQTQAVDVYPVGLIAYEMLTGMRPFNPKTIYEMPQLQRDGVTVRPSEMREDIPAEAEELILQSLEYDAEKRPANIRAFGRKLAAALRRATEGESVNNGQMSVTKAPVNASDSITKRGVKTMVSDIPVNDLPLIEPIPPRRFSTGMMAGAAGLGVLIIALVVGLVYFRDPGKPSPQPAANLGLTGEVSDKTPHKLLYFLEIQKTRNGKPFEEPFRATGREIFESGYKFKIMVNSDSPGYLYLLNEGKNATGQTEFYFLHPVPSRNGGSPEIRANSQIEPPSGTFSGGKGKEIMWLVWTAEAQADLEAARKSAFAGETGAVGDLLVAEKLREFLRKNNENPPKTAVNSETYTTTVNGEGDFVVHRFELEHK